MGYIWTYTRNVTIDDGLVHRAMRDIKPEAERGRVLVVCREGFYYTKRGPVSRGQVIASYTRRKLNCIRCLGSHG